MIEINDKKSIGRVLFIVEGSKTEFAILRKIFCDILKYEYIEKRRNRPDTFKSKNNSTSKVAVINTEESNINYITDSEEYLDVLFEMIFLLIMRQYIICLTEIRNQTQMLKE